MKKMVESHVKLSGDVWWRPVEVLVSKVDHIKGSSIVKDRGRYRKTIGETIKRDLNFIGLNVDKIYDKTL